MEQVEDGITLAGSLVTCWGIDGHTAVDALVVGVIPDLADGAVGNVAHLVEVNDGITIDEQDAGERSHVAVDIDVRGIDHRLAIDTERIVVEFGSYGFGGGVFPNAILALLEFGKAWAVEFAEGSLDLLGGEEVTGHLYLDGLGCGNAEGYGAVGIDFGRLDRSTAPESLLCHGSAAYEQGCCQKKIFFHNDINSSKRGVKE